MRFAEVGGLITGVFEEVADGSVFGGETGLVLVEAVDDHHAAFVWVESSLESSTGGYALAVASIGVGEVHAFFGDAIQRGRMGDVIDETHALVLHLIAHQD